MTTRLSNKDKLIEVGIKNSLIVDKFKRKLSNKSTGCIEFTGTKSDKGYGMLNCSRIEGTPASWVKAHRFAYALYYGFDKLPKGTDTTQKRKVIHHKCENKACVNPLHLEVVTDRWNLGIVNDKNMF